MSHYEEMMKTIKAAAYSKGVPKMAKEAQVSDDTLRRILSDEPPESVARLKRLEEIATAKPEQ